MEVQNKPIFARLDSVACSEAAKGLVSSVCTEAARWEADHQRLKKRRSAKDAISFNKAIEKLLADIFRGHQQGTSVYRSLKREAFNDAGVGYRSFRAAVEALIGIGLVSHTPGAPRYRIHFEDFREKLPGKASEFTATAELLRRADAHGVSVDIGKHFIPELPRHPLKLNARSSRVGGDKVRGKPMSISPDDQAAQLLEKQVRDINEFLAGFTIQGANHHGFNRIFGCGDDDDFRWNKGGRLYAAAGDEDNYQHMPATREGDRPGRDEITIDDEPVVEIDIRSCNLTIFYALLGEPLDLTNDPFSNLGIDRSLAKAWTNACFGAGRLLERWPPKLSADYEDEYGHRPKLTARAVGAKVLERLPHLKRLNDPDAPQWFDLQFRESETMIRTITALMRLGIPALPVHDSLLVPQRHLETASACLADSFEKVVGVRPVITVKGRKGLKNPNEDE
ncbi:MAG: hypothetical protein U1E81_20240 [Xanthobacteraceae bacterium]